MTINARYCGERCFLLRHAVALPVHRGMRREKKMEPVKPGELETYRDPGFGYSIGVPEGMDDERRGRAADSTAGRRRQEIP